MEKIWLIIQREYITRVRKKSFILLTLLGPLFMGGLFAGVIYMQTHSDKTISNIQVVDETPYAEYARTLKSSESVKYFADTASFANAREKFNKVNFYGLLHIYQSAENKDSTVFQLYTEKLVSLGTVSRIEDDIQKIYDEQQLVKNNIDPLLLKSLHKSISISTKTLQGDGKGDSEVSAGAALFQQVILRPGVLKVADIGNFDQGHRQPCQARRASARPVIMRSVALFPQPFQFVKLLAASVLPLEHRGSARHDGRVNDEVDDPCLDPLAHILVRDNLAGGQVVDPSLCGLSGTLHVAHVRGSLCDQVIAQRVADGYGGEFFIGADVVTHVFLLNFCARQILHNNTTH